MRALRDRGNTSVTWLLNDFMLSKSYPLSKVLPGRWYRVSRVGAWTRVMVPLCVLHTYRGVFHRHCKRGWWWWWWNQGALREWGWEISSAEVGKMCADTKPPASRLTTTLASNPWRRGERRALENLAQYSGIFFFSSQMTTTHKNMISKNSRKILFFSFFFLMRFSVSCIPKFHNGWVHSPSCSSYFSLSLSLSH